MKREFVSRPCYCLPLAFISFFKKHVLTKNNRRYDVFHESSFCSVKHTKTRRDFCLKIEESEGVRKMVPFQVIFSKSFPSRKVLFFCEKILSGGVFSQAGKNSHSLNLGYLVPLTNFFDGVKIHRFCRSALCPYDKDSGKRVFFLSRLPYFLSCSFLFYFCLW